jgi:cytochrome c oxidase cbb3-type subunit III
MRPTSLAAAVAGLAALSGGVLAQTSVPGALEPMPEALMQVPVTGIRPGGVSVAPDIRNPVAGNEEALHRGMEYFNAFNCSGCHAPNGGGGMGISLSNSLFKYGDRPEQIYLSIAQGRPLGMPAWGESLPAPVIWDLVTYIQSISKEPDAPWGRTTSKVPPKAPQIEQVPAEFLTTVRPWEHTIPFSSGQRPFEKAHKPPSAHLESEVEDQ